MSPLNLHEKTGKSGWTIKWLAPFSLGSFRKYGLWFKVMQYSYLSFEVNFSFFSLGYRKISWFVSILQINYLICLSLRLWQIINLLATDKSRYFAQPPPIIVNYLVCFSLSIIWICIAAGRWISHLAHLVKIYCFKNGPLEELWGLGWGFFEPHENSLVWIFYPLVWAFLTLLGVHEYFSFNFPLHELIFLYFVPPPSTISFLMTHPLIMNIHKIFTCLICVNSEHPLFINVNYAMHAKRLKVDEKEFSYY